MRLAAAQQRLDDAPDALFLQLIGQLIEMGLAPQDELLLRGEDGLARDWVPSVLGVAVKTGFVGQRVDQPRLPLGLRPDRLHRLGGERLAGLFSVLPQQGEHLLVRKVAQPQ